jgi:hypothetical protein
MVVVGLRKRRRKERVLRKREKTRQASAAARLNTTFTSQEAVKTVNSIESPVIPP